MQGARVCALLLETLPPIAAITYVHDMVDLQMPLLPADVRSQVSEGYGWLEMYICGLPWDTLLVYIFIKTGDQHAAAQVVLMKLPFAPTASTCHACLCCS
jgi:hypothetical protein